MAAPALLLLSAHPSATACSASREPASTDVPMATAALPNCPFAAALAPLLLSAPLQETAHFAFQEPANTDAPTNSCAMCHLLKFVSQLHAPRRPSAPLAIATCASRVPASTDALTGTAKFLICFPLAAATVLT